MKKVILSGVALAALMFSPVTAEAGDHGKKGYGYDKKAEKMADKQDLVTIAMSNENFKTLVAAVSAAGLVEALQGDGPLTIFAPTDAAFDALPEGTLDNLLLPENKDQLATILKYHVVPAKVKAADAIGNAVELETLSGIALPVDGTGDGVIVGGANVTATDIKGSNGIIHVIDSVILPPSE